MVRHIRLRWVHFLPILHLCACMVSMAAYLSPISEFQHLGIVWTWIMMADLPISIVAYGLAWQHGALAAIWIFVAGTYWWYLLSRGAEFLIDSMRRRKPVSLFSPNRSQDKL